MDDGGDIMEAEVREEVWVSRCCSLELHDVG